MSNYWARLIDDKAVKKEELFFKTRDLYLALLRHLYNDPKNIPEVCIHFSNRQISVEEGTEKGYSVSTVFYRTKKVRRRIIKDITEIENFENSYTWYQDDIFVIFDFKEDSISPLHFITAAFCEELFRQYDMFGLKKVKISHMFENLISNGVVQFFHGFYNLDINFVQTLSALPYEGMTVDCSILVPRYDAGNEKRTGKSGLDVVFKEPIPFAVSNLRQVRKLVEMSDKDLAIVIHQDGKIHGLASAVPNASECKIRMWGNLSWTITYNGGKKISYYSAHYHIHPKVSKDYSISKSLGDVIDKLNPESQSMIESVIRAAAKQHHGTILIIGDPESVMSETNRLCDAKSATGIAKLNLFKKMNLIYYLTSIDGAVIMDTECNCSCIGAILDGDVTSKGNPARGARFNSTVHYIKRRSELKEHFTGIVISEDGTIDAVTEDKVNRINIQE